MPERLLAFLRNELTLSPARWKAIGRVVVACAIATTAVMTFRIPEGGWLIITIFVVSQPDIGASLRRALQRLGGTFLGALGAIFLAVALPQQPWFQLPLLAAAIAFGVYLSRTSAQPYIPLLAVLTMVLAVDMNPTDPSASVETALWRFFNIATGNLIGTLCQAWLWPEDTEALLLDHLAGSLRESDKRIEQALLPLDEVTTDAARLGASEERVMNSLGQWTTWLTNAEHGGSGLRRHHEDLVDLIGDVNQIAIASQQIARAASALAARGVAADVPEPLHAVADALRERCRVAATAIEARSWTPELDTLEELVPPLTRALAVAEDSNLTRSTQQNELLRAAILSSALSVAEGLDSLHDAVDFLRPREQRRHEERRSPLFRTELSAFVPAPPEGARSADIAASLKASLAAILAWIYLNAIDWPGGITAVVTAVLCSLDNYGAMIQKAVLRFGGALIGGLIALLAITVFLPNITSLPGFLILTTIIFGIGAWVQSGTVRISYAGVQLAYAATLMLINSFEPSVDLTPFRDRVTGIFVGILAVVFVYAIFGEVRARVWALDNAAGTLRMLAQAASIGLRGLEPAQEEAPAGGYRQALCRRLSFSYRLLTESSWEDWLSADREASQAEVTQLRRVLDRVRAVYRVTVSLIWNRLEFQRRSGAEDVGRPEVQAVGRAVPEALRLFAKRLEHAGEPDAEAEACLAQLRARIDHAARILDSLDAGHALPPERRLFQRRMRAQLGFYEHLIALLGYLDEDARSLRVGEDTFSVAGWLRGPTHRHDMPSIRPT